MWNPFKNKTNLPATTGTTEIPVVEAIEHVEDVNSLPVINDVSDLKALDICSSTINNALDVYKTSLLVEQNIATIKAATDIKLAQITSKYNLCRAMLEQTFRERSQGLNAHYAILDKAIAAGDRELVIHALQGISSIVVSNPIDKFSEMVKNWDSYSKSNPLQLDF